MQELHPRPRNFKEVVDVVESEARGLEFNQNKLSEKETEVLVALLKKTATLKALSLYQTAMSVQSAMSLGECLKYNTSLTYLNLSCGMGDRGAKAMAHSLRKNTTLHRLFLPFNKISDQGATQLAQSLRENASLKELVLRYNNIGETGAAALKKCLRTNHTLTALLIGDPYDDYYQDLLQRNKDAIANKQEQLFQEAISTNSKGEWNRSKLIVVGGIGTGKTAVVGALTGVRCDTQLASTVGVEISEIETASAGQWIKANPVGIKDFTSALAARVALKTLDRDEAKKKRRNKNVLQSVKSKFAALKDSYVSFGANGPSEKAEEAYDSTSSSNRDSVRSFHPSMIDQARRHENSITFSVWDYGKQSVIYSLHHLFLTRYGTYILVFRLDKLRTQDLEEIRTWLKVIGTFAPEAPVFIVGTFLCTAESEGTLAEANEAIEDLVDKNPQVVLNMQSSMTKHFFPVDNRGHSGIIPLRKTIEAVAREQPFVHIEISMRWMQCLDMILASVKEDNLIPRRSWVLYTKVVEIAAACDIRSIVEVNDMLCLFHELGVLLHFSSTEALRDIVTTHPQWIMDAIGKVMELDVKKHEQDIRANGLEDDMHTLVNKCLASRDLLVYLWGKEHFSFFLDLLHNLLLLSSWKFGGSPGETRYLIPSMMKQAKSNESLASRQLGGSMLLDTRCELDFGESFLPDGVFERLVCLCIEYSSSVDQSLEPVIDDNAGYDIWFGPSATIKICREDDKILVSASPAKEAANCIEIVLAMMVKLKDDFGGAGLSWIASFVSNGKSLKYRKAKTELQHSWFRHVSNKAVPLDLDTFLLKA